MSIRYKRKAISFFGCPLSCNWLFPSSNFCLYLFSAMVSVSFVEFSTWFLDLHCTFYKHHEHNLQWTVKWILFFFSTFTWISIHGVKIIFTTIGNRSQFLVGLQNESQQNTNSKKQRQKIQTPSEREQWISIVASKLWCYVTEWDRYTCI